MFELRRLRLLHELSLRGTIAEVAASLSFSPSTVSQQLALLEKEAGVPLLEPDGRRVRLTEHGRVLVAHAARALDLDEAARNALASVSPGSARVRIAVMPTAAESLVPPALTLLAERFHGLRVDMAELAPERALFELSARTFDLVIAEQYPGTTRELVEGIDRVLIGRDPVRIALPAADPARDLADLRAHTWVLEPRGTAVREWAQQQCRSAGFEPDVRFEATDLIAHVRLIAAGHAVGMLPDLVWSERRDGIRLVDLPGGSVRDIFAATRVASRDSPAVSAVRTALADALAARRSS